MKNVFDVAVVGAGPAGLVTAAALAQCGFQTVCAGPAFVRSGDRMDTRTIALMGGSINLLQTLKVWSSCSDHAQPLRSIQMIDNTGNAWSGPPVLFHANELGLDVFGYNVPNVSLVAALQDNLASLEDATYVETSAVSGIEKVQDGYVLHLQKGGDLRARCVVGADGRNSIVREFTGIDVVRWDHGQSAIACDLTHSKAHHDISTEFHCKSGPFTFVPLPGNRSGLVWVERSDRAEELKAMDDASFISESLPIHQGFLGDITAVGPRALFPLQVQTAKAFGKGGVALVGETAHVVPPIGAQGLNLSFRDAAMFAECAASSRSQDPSGWVEQAVREYDRKRGMDVWSRTAAVDVLNRSLLSDFLPFQAARTATLHAVRLFGPLRRFVMRRGLEPISDRPRLMQPGAQMADLAFVR